MKKLNKIVLALAVLSCFAFSLSAQQAISDSKRSTKVAVSSTTERFVPGSEKIADTAANENTAKACKMLIGFISEIDGNDDSIAVVDVDGKVHWVRMSPFTTHAYTEYQSDLRVNDWVKIELFNTDTQILEADTIYAYRQRKQSSKKYINSPDPLAK